MSEKKNKKRKFIKIAGLILFCIIFILLVLKACNQEVYNGDDDILYTPIPNDTAYVPPALEPDDGYGEIVYLEDFDMYEMFNVDSFPSDCQEEVQLLIADVYGKPLKVSDTIEINLINQLLFEPSNNIGFLQPNINNFELITTPDVPPSSGISFISPVENSVLNVDSTFILEWEIDSARELTIDILLSTDGGENFIEIAKEIENTSSLSMTVPSIISDNCIFRINAWVGTTLLGYNDSPVFSIVDEQAVIENITPIPDDFEYTADDGVFISSTGDTVRQFKLEYELPNVNRAVWQLSRTRFLCGIEDEIDNPSGMIAWGDIDEGIQEFNLDFGSILSQFDVANNNLPVGTKVENQGSPYEIVPDVALLDQIQRDLFLRVILYDENDNIIGITGSGFQLVYGQPIVDINNVDDNSMEYPAPILSAKTVAGFEPGSFEEIPEKGVFVFKDDLFDKSFMLSDIPTNSVEIDFQISTLPFKNEIWTDYTQPNGLIYQDKISNLTYTTKTRYYNISFADFAPELVFLGDNTVRYYIRAVCYIPGNTAGSTIPISTKEASIVFTGDHMVMIAGNYDPSTFPSEEVVVKSNVPVTDFKRYVAARWAIKDADEYFEVTRPIQAEEMAFYIKNNKTGDFLYPYGMHMMMFPGTTRAEYQATLDKMLPEGSWFHLTITQSGWDSFWSEFFDLLGQIYDNIREHYNGMKISIANAVADRFAFFGEDVQSAIRSSVHALINYGLAYVGLPPTLPNFEEFADQGMDYCVRIALEETAKSMDIPVDQIPDEVRYAIAEEVSNELEVISNMKNVNPLDLNYLRPSSKAMYRPAFVDVEIFNTNQEPSPTGTLMVSYYPPGSPHFRIYKGACLPIPSLEHNEHTFIRIYLAPGNTELPVYKEYFWGNEGECELVITANYDVPSPDEAAAQQGVKGESEIYPDEFVYDIDPHFEYRKINTPSENLYD